MGIMSERASARAHAIGPIYQSREPWLSPDERAGEWARGNPNFVKKHPGEVSSNRQNHSAETLAPSKRHSCLPRRVGGGSAAFFRPLDKWIAVYFKPEFNSCQDRGMNRLVVGTRISVKTGVVERWKGKFSSPHRRWLLVEFPGESRFFGGVADGRGH